VGQHWDHPCDVSRLYLFYLCVDHGGAPLFRTHAEIKLAQEIHQVLVPTIDTKLGGFEFYGRSSPSGEVGGDLIDVTGTAENWLRILADVSGTGWRRDW